MRRLKYIFLSLLLCTGISYLLFFVYKAGYNHHYAQEIALMNERLSGNEPYDILLLGSSRTCHQLNPRIVDSVVDANSFNAGLDGIKLMEINTILECYLQTHKQTKMVVMDLPPASFNSDLFPFFNQTLYYPFLDNKIVFNNLKDHRPVFLLKNLPFLQLTEIDDEMRQRAMAGLFGASYSSPGDYYKGFSAPPADTIRFPFRPEAGTNAPITQKGIDYLKRTIELCRTRNIDLMIIYPPAYKSLELELNPDFYTTAKQICDKEGVIIKDYRNMAIKDDHHFFRDQTHLNMAGSGLFSTLVANDIKAHLQRKENNNIVVK